MHLIKEVIWMEEALKDSILGALEMVIDPELGIDIVNLISANTVLT
jgi:metal-sulfur cluster biosynthetic enzyme